MAEGVVVTFACDNSDLSCPYTPLPTIENIDEFSDASNPLSVAALWLSVHRSECPEPIIPFVQERFSLTPLQAIEALKTAHKIKWRAA